LSVAKTILHSLIYNEAYGRKVIPYLKLEYFKEPSDKFIFQIINGYVEKYGSFPNLRAIAIELSESNAEQDLFDECKETLVDFNEPEEELEFQWLLDTTEKYCQERAIELAIQKSISIIEGKEKIAKTAIPTILQEALNITFNTSIGHDYIDDALLRLEIYHENLTRVPFHLDHLNKLTRGGVPKKSLSVIMAPTGVGKTILMADCAAHQLMDGKNVLYITLEMSEEMISERIDANLMDIDVSMIREIPKDAFMRKIDRMKNKPIGKLIIEEFPTSGAGAHHFRLLLDELKVKRNFVPDIIYIDYLNLCLSVRQTKTFDSYSNIKMIAEELRGLSIIYDVPIVTATQTNRGGYNSSELDLDDTSESFGLPMTADFFIAITSSKELETLGQVLVHHLKNRWNDTNFRHSWLMGMDKPKMRLYDLPTETQETLTHVEKPVDENSPVSKLKRKPKKNFDKFNKG
jgi:replicative DNA helicase